MVKVWVLASPLPKPHAGVGVSQEPDEGLKLCDPCGRHSLLSCELDYRGHKVRVAHVCQVGVCLVHLPLLSSWKVAYDLPVDDAQGEALVEVDDKSHEPPGV